jgi:polyketide synthase PksJ
MGESSNKLLYNKINSVFAPRHAERIKSMMQNTEWMIEGLCTEYQYIDSHGKQIIEDLELGETSKKGFFVSNPSGRFLAAHKGEPYFKTVLDVYFNPVVHLACLEPYIEKKTDVWMDEMVEKFTKNSTDGVDMFEIILSILGVQATDSLDTLKEALKDTTDDQLDYLEFLITRSPWAYDIFRRRKKKEKSYLLHPKHPKHPSHPNHLNHVKHPEHKKKPIKPDIVLQHRVEFEIRNIASHEFLKFIDSKSEGINYSVFMTVACRESALPEIMAYRPKAVKAVKAVKTVESNKKVKTPDFPKSGNALVQIDQVVLFSGFRDAKLELYITSRGGIVKTSLTKTVTLVIAKNPDKETAKIKEAIARGTPVISLERFKHTHSIVD